MAGIQLKTKQLRAYDKKCIGCQGQKADIMISAMDKRDDNIEFYDFFLDQEAAELFHDELGKAINRNKDQENGT